MISGPCQKNPNESLLYSGFYKLLYYSDLYLKAGLRLQEFLNLNGWWNLVTSRTQGELNLKPTHTAKFENHDTLQHNLKIIMPDLAPQGISQGNRCKQNGYCVTATWCRHYMMRDYKGSRVVSTFPPAIPPSPLSTKPIQLLVFSLVRFKSTVTSVSL